MIEYGEIQLPLLNGYDLNKSSQTVSFSNLKCDFTNHTSDDLPQRYQECNVYVNNELKFVGYINGCSFKEMRETDNFLEAEFELLSPMAMTTLRTQTATGNYKLKDLVNFIFEPLINDGFKMKELDIPDYSLTINYVCETIEYIMSDLSNKYSIWWFIDENKNIYVRDIESMLNSNPLHIYDNTHKISGLQYIRPTIMVQDYANVINFTNVRIYQRSYKNFDYGNDEENPLISEQISSMTNGQELIFNHPVDFKYDNILKSYDSLNTEGMILVDYAYGINIRGTYSDHTTFTIYLRYNGSTQEWEMTNNFAYDGDSETDKEFLFIRDNFFSNLITGVRYNGNKTISSINVITSDSALVWSINKLFNDSEISNKSGIISPSGIVELTINMNEQWKTLNELFDIASSYVYKSSLSIDGQLELKIDRDVFKVGDIIKINKLLFNNKYIITKIKETNTKRYSEYIITCKNINVDSNYIDLFRNKTTQDNDEKTYQTIISHYSQEGIKEVHEVVE